MKNKLKAALALCLLMAMVVTAFLPSSSSAKAEVAADSAGGFGFPGLVTAVSSAQAGSMDSHIDKDETIYALLNSDGSVGSLYAVNHFPVTQAGRYTDYGRYSKIESITEDIQPVMDGNKILWDLKAGSRDFYYKGTLAEGELPWNFSISYTLDSVAVEAKELAGKSGRVEIEFSVNVNDKARACFRDQYAMMAQIPVNLDCASIISAEGATQVIAGKTDTLAYTVLPGTSKTFRLDLQVSDFEMDPVNIGISLADYGNVVEAGDISGGFERMGDGVSAWLEGVNLLKDGMAGLVKGVGDLSAGLNALTGNGRKIAAGMTDFAGGLEAFNESFKPVIEGSGKINGGLGALTENGAGVLSGYKQMASSIAAQLPSEAEKAQLQSLAQYVGSSDPAYRQLGQIAQSLLEQGAGMEALYQNLNTLNNGLEQYTGGVTALSQEYRNFDQGLNALSQGSAQLAGNFTQMAAGSGQFTEGLAALNDGLAETNKNISLMPENVGKLADGASSIKAGIDKAEESITRMIGEDKPAEKVISFVSPDNVSVRSVQFILRTPAIAIPDNDGQATVETVSRKTFLQKLAALFM